METIGNMINDYQEIVKSLKGKINTVIELYEREKKSNEQLISENKKLNLEIINQNNKINNIENNYTKLKIAKTILSSSDDAHDAKIKINRIVREIDNCIALLNR